MSSQWQAVTWIDMSLKYLHFFLLYIHFMLNKILLDFQNFFSLESEYIFFSLFEINWTEFEKL